MKVKETVVKRIIGEKLPEVGDIMESGDGLLVMVTEWPSDLKSTTFSGTVQAHGHYAARGSHSNACVKSSFKPFTGTITLECEA